MTRYFFASNGITPLQLFELPPMPWISNRTSPAPSSRYATRSPCNIMILRFAVPALFPQSDCAARLGGATRAGTVATAAQAVAPTNRVFMAFITFAPCAVPRRGDLSLMIARSLPDRLRVCRPALLACAHYSHKQRSSRFAHNAQRWVGLLSALIQLVSGSTTHEPWRSTPVTASSESSTT